jgi:hypothetical protein
VIELLIVILVVVWLLGYFGRARIPRMQGRSGNLIHLLLVIILILILLRLLR